MAEKKFSKGEAIKFGWAAMKSNLGFFIPLLIVVFLIWVIFSFGNQYALGFTGVIMTLYFIISTIIQMIVGLGLTRISLRFCDNEKGRWSDLFSSYPLFFNYLLGSILYILIVLAGTVLFVIPGIIWAIQFGFFYYFIIDKGLGPIEALQKSSAITRGTKWNLFLFILLLFGILLVGFLALGIGLFAAMPTVIVADAFVYRKLLAHIEIDQTPETSLAGLELAFIYPHCALPD